MVSLGPWVAGLMLGCKSQDDGNGISVSHLFAGFQNKLGQLILLSLIIGIISIVIMVASMGSLYAQLLAVGMGVTDPADVDPAFIQDPIGTFLLPFLIAMLFIIPVMMMAWFAPLLIVLNDVPVFKAMGMSFKGCLKNFVPFLIYGIVLFVLYIVAIIPLALGLLVLMPTFFGSWYRSYKDIYIET